VRQSVTENAATFNINLLDVRQRKLITVIGFTDLVAFLGP
jgi:ethanolamine utilization protein EutP (predicted NTPase)